MSKIITIFTNPGTLDTGQSSVTNKVSTPLDVIRETIEVDENAFNRSRHVGRLYGALKKAKWASSNLDSQESYAVLEGAQEDLNNLQEALDQFYSELGATDAVVGAVEITDAQYNYLQSNQRAMDVFINNAIINPDNLDWVAEKIDNREEAAQMLKESSEALSNAIYDSNDWEDDFYEEDEEDNWDEDDFDQNLENESEEDWEDEVESEQESEDDYEDAWDRVAKDTTIGYIPISSLLNKDDDFSW